MNRKIMGYTLAPLALLVLSACGGSSDGGGTAKYDPLAITESNAKSVTREVLISSQDIDTQGGEDILAYDPVSSKSAPIQKILTSSNEGAYATPKLSQTEQCEGGGSITLTAYTAETISFSANNCTFNDTSDNDGQPITIRIDGKVTLAQQSPSGFPPRQGFPTADHWNGITLSFSQKDQWQCTFNSFDIQVTGAENVSMTYDGNMLVKAGTNLMDNLVYSAINSSSLSMNVPDGSFSLSGLSFEALSSTDNNGFAFTEMIYNTTYGSSSLAGVGGQVTVTTLENLIYDETKAGQWQSGKLKIVGADSSSVTVTIPGQASDVQLEIDSDGDGEADQVQDLTWAELEAEQG